MILVDTSPVLTGTTSWLTLATVALVFLTALAGFLVSTRRIKAVDTKVQEIHVLVNSQMTATVARVEQLINAMELAHLDVPPNRNGEGGVTDQAQALP